MTKKLEETFNIEPTPEEVVETIEEEIANNRGI